MRLFRPALLRTISQLCAHHNAIPPLVQPALPFPTTPLPRVKMVLFDIYGTLLHSRRGEISIHSYKAGMGTDADDKYHRTHIESLCEIMGIRSQSHRHREKIMSKIRRTITTRIRLHHTAAHQRGIKYPEVDIRVIWRDTLRELRHNTIHSGVVGRHTPLRIMQIALRWETLVNEVSLMPGAHSVLGALRLRKLPLGIVSNAQFYTPLLLEFLFGSSLYRVGFVSSLSAWSYRYGCAKPGVELFKRVVNRARRRWGLRRSEILYVGNDIRNDIWCAARVGLRTCLFAGDKYSLRLRERERRYSNTTPDTCIGALEKLPELLV